MKNFAKTSLFFISQLLLFSGFAKGAMPAALDSIKADIENINKRYGNAFANNDLTAFLTCYTPDGCVMPVNSPKLCGAQGLTIFFNAAYKMGIRNIVFTSKEFFGQTADTITEEGVYELFNEGKKSLEHGKYLAVWKKTSHGWQMHRDIFTRDAEPVMAKPNQN